MPKMLARLDSAWDIAATRHSGLTQRPATTDWSRWLCADAYYARQRDGCEYQGFDRPSWPNISARLATQRLLKDNTISEYEIGLRFEHRIVDTSLQDAIVATSTRRVNCSFRFQGGEQIL